MKPTLTPTPTPWHLPSGWETVGVAIGEIPIFSSDEEVVAKCRAKENRRTLSDNIAANAAHIVKCVNAWDDVKALEARLIELRGGKNV